MSKEHTVVLAGNPNSGKTTIFNNLTGSRQKVGNYPGVTVEKKEGRCIHKGHNLSCVDLPGTYSLSALSVEEVVARNFLLNEKPDVVVDVVDSSNLERNLYLGVQLLEMHVPLVLAFNVFDVAESRGLKFDFKTFSRKFGAPIVCTVGSKGKGMEELLTAISEVADQKEHLKPAPISYGEDIDAELKILTKLIEKEGDFIKTGIPASWYALKLLENDPELTDKITSTKLRKFVEQSKKRLQDRLGDSAEIAIAEHRYGFISGVCTETVTSTVETRHTTSDKIDQIILNRALGLPIFFGLMYLLFHLTFSLGQAPMEWIEGFFNWLSGQIIQFWPRGSDSILKSLLVDGVIGGVGGVIVFLPNIVLLFTAITFLETTGYMARAAFLLDKVMHKLGLNGKSFIPMLTGFGCSVPAIMATRTLGNDRDRLATMLVVPLMSCSARLPIYALIIPAFFAPGQRAGMMFLIYMIGIILAITLAKLLRVTVLKSKSEPFVLELPPYRMPTLKSILIHTFERSWLYVKKAGTVILGIALILWALTAFPKKTVYERNYESEAAVAKTAYMKDISKLEASMKLNETQLLTQAINAQFSFEEKKAIFHKMEPGFIQAERVYNETLTDLYKKESGMILNAFLTTRDGISQERDRFNTYIETTGLNKDRDDLTSEELDKYLQVETIMTIKLDELRRKSPDVYDEAILFLDTVRPTYDTVLTEMTQAQQSEDLTYTCAGRIGKAIEPIFKPLGFDWRIDTALIGAFAAKEVFVSQLGIVFSLGETDEESGDLKDQLRAHYSPLVAFVIMLFCLISAPCMATIAVTKRESNSWKWAMVQLGGLTFLAYIICLAVYQIGTLLHIGVS